MLPLGNVSVDYLIWFYFHLLFKVVIHQQSNIIQFRIMLMNWGMFKNYAAIFFSELLFSSPSALRHLWICLLIKSDPFAILNTWLWCQPYLFMFSLYCWNYTVSMRFFFIIFYDNDKKEIWKQTIHWKMEIFSSF